MIKTLLGILLIILITITIFILFPDTGKYGNYFLYGYIAIFSFFYLYLTLNLKMFNIFPLSLILKIIFFIVMIFVILVFTLQEDKKTIFSKIMKGNFPDAETIDRGKIKYINGIFMEPIKINMKTLEKETQKFFEKIK